MTKTQLDIAPDEVVLAPPRTVPKTSSGKLRRSAARTLYESGSLSKKGYALWWQLTRLSLSGLGHRARRLRRRIFDLVYAGYWWAVLVAGASMVWSAVLLLPSRGWRHQAIHYVARTFLWLTGLSPKVEVEEPIPARSVLLAVNHCSYLDPVVLSAVIPGPLSFVAKEELAGQRVAGPFLRRIGTLFVRRTDVKGGVEDTRNVLEASLSGERIVSFPEGTLTRMPGLTRISSRIFPCCRGGRHSGGAHRDQRHAVGFARRTVVSPAEQPKCAHCESNASRWKRLQCGRPPARRGTREDARALRRTGSRAGEGTAVKRSRPAAATAEIAGIGNTPWYERRPR